MTDLNREAAELGEYDDDASNTPAPEPEPVPEPEPEPVPESPKGRTSSAGGKGTDVPASPARRADEPSSGR